MIYSVLSSVAKQSGGVPIAVERRFNKLATNGYETTILTLAYQKKFDEFVEWFYQNDKINRKVQVLSLINEIENLVTHDFIDVNKMTCNEMNNYVEEQVIKANYLEYINYKVDNVLKFREEYAQGNIRALREYYKGYHYLTVVNNGKALLKVKVTKTIWSEPVIPGLNKEFETMQDLFKYLLELKVKDGDTIFSEFRDHGLPYLYGGEFDLVISSLSSGIKKIAAIHTTHLEYPYNDVNKFDTEYKKLFKLSTKFDKLMVLTQEQKDDIQSLCDIDNIVVLPHPFHKHMVENRERNINEIAVITRLAVKKNFDLVLDIQEEIQKRNLPYYINVYGKVAVLEDYPRVEKIINDKKLKVNIMGTVNNIDDVLAGSKCLLVTSIGEGQCMSICESLSTKTPVVTSNFKYGSKDVIRNRKNGYIIDINQDKEKYVNKFVDAIEKVSKIKYKEKNYDLKRFDEDYLYNILIKKVLGE